MNILITGGAGFIGSALVRYLIQNTPHRVANVDKLTYAGNLDSLTVVEETEQYCFFRNDICDRAGLERIFEQFRPDAVMHLAAESHVDRSIDNPADFINSNMIGTYQLLECCRSYWQGLSGEARNGFRLLHISTDEVYGDLPAGEALFTETTRYAPSSPYAATKASSDHLVYAWQRTYGLPVLISHCSNNYGPCQFPEKLIPHMILSALQGAELPLYGDGRQSRDWLYVDDHVRALLLILERGEPGQTYNIGGQNELQNREVVEQLCDLLQELQPGVLQGGRFRDLIRFVADRPGHDRRYAIDAGKMAVELGWRPEESFSSGLRKTLLWYLSNPEWWQRVLNGDYRLVRQGGVL